MKETAQIFKALSDETRLRILGLLLESELCVCELMAILDIPQSTISRHLAYLKNSGLVIDQRRGIWMHYRLAAGGSGIHQHLLDMLRKDLARLDEVRADKKALKEFQAAKRSATCCK
jgi:ArsR family transcriptional regulator